MCGIVGYTGKKQAEPILIDGLKRLEYRGYDSAGITTLESGASRVTYVKEKGKIKNLVARLQKKQCKGTTGIGHTRWATHGEPSRVNAHPHCDTTESFAVVHNGIFENFQEIRSRLQKKGVRFRSETDTECVVHLIAQYYTGDLRHALERAVSELKGSFVVLAISSKNPQTIVAFKRSNPLIVGVGKGANYFASDVSALLPYTKNVIYVKDNQTVVLTPETVTVFHHKAKRPCKISIEKIQWTIEKAQKQGYPHFMLKEIHEQAEVLEATIQKLVNEQRECVRFETINATIGRRIKVVNKVFIVSCGTAYHAGLAAKYMIEDYAKIPVEVNVSSEFRYSDPILSKDDLVLFISQSGETADTLAALHEAKKKGAITLAICNVVGSTIARESDAVIHTHAGPEIGVASTKAYLAQLMTLCLLAIYFGRLRKEIKRKNEQRLLKSVRRLPRKVREIIEEREKVLACAKKLKQAKNFIYLGRGFNYATALEGALKLKEISYIHAHGYAAGEMKHGPIALVDPELPIVCIASDSKTYDKMLSNIQEVKARDGIVVAVVTRNNKDVKKYADYIFEVGKTYELMSPILTIVPLQFLAYYVAVLNGCDVDQPKNLAKSVTVE